MYGDAAGNQLTIPRREHQRLAQAGHEVDTGRAGGGVAREGKFLAESFVENFKFYAVHDTSWRWFQ